MTITMTDLPMVCYCLTVPYQAYHTVRPYLARVVGDWMVFTGGLATGFLAEEVHGLDHLKAGSWPNHNVLTRVSGPHV